jgi:hypothetical protein
MLKLTTNQLMQLSDNDLGNYAEDLFIEYLSNRKEAISAEKINASQRSNDIIFHRKEGVSLIFEVKAARDIADDGKPYNTFFCETSAGSAYVDNHKWNKSYWRQQADKISYLVYYSVYDNEFFFYHIDDFAKKADQMCQDNLVSLNAMETGLGFTFGKRQKNIGFAASYKIK